MRILLIAESHQQQVSNASIKCLTAASQLKLPIHVLIAAPNASNLAQSFQHYPCIEKIITIEDPQLQYPLAEEMHFIINQLLPDYSHFMMAATSQGKDWLPRIAACAGSAVISDIIAVENSTNFKRPIYAGNAINAVTSCSPQHFITVRSSAFAPYEQKDSNHHVEIESRSFTPQGAPKTRILSIEQQTSDRPELTNARIVLSGGRGLGSKEHFDLLLPLAERLQAALGASRAAVDAGYAPNDWQVGQTGKIVAPELYIAIGISGAIQHIAGMKESKIIVAINKDENAPIFEIASYGLVMDLFDAIRELEQALS
jgi:electron transfer flavoprotein alpha subunit